MNKTRTITALYIKAKDYKVGDWLLDKDEINYVRHVGDTVIIRTKKKREIIFDKNDKVAKWYAEE